MGKKYKVHKLYQSLRIYLSLGFMYPVFTHMPGDSCCRWFRSLDAFMWHLSSTSWLPSFAWSWKWKKMTNSGFESLRMFASLAQTEWLPDWEFENVCLSDPNRMTPWLSLRMFASLAQTEWLPDWESENVCFSGPNRMTPWLRVWVCLPLLPKQNGSLTLRVAS